MTGYAFRGNDCISISILSNDWLSNQFFSETECKDCDISWKSCTGLSNLNCKEWNKGYTMVGGYWVCYYIVFY